MAAHDHTQPGTHSGRHGNRYSDREALIARIDDLRRTLSEVDRICTRARFSGRGDEVRTQSEVEDLAGDVRAALSFPRSVAEELGESEVSAELKAAGVELSLSEDGLRLAATPAENMVPKLRAAFSLNHDRLMRGVLFMRAQRFVASYIRDGEGSLDTPAAEAGLAALASSGEDIEQAWHEADLEEFREALRHAAKTAVAAYRRSVATRDNGARAEAADGRGPQTARASGVA